MTVIQTAAVYAPTDDLPSFRDTVYEKLNSGTTLHKLIIGDFNVTLQHNLDSHGYKTDPHPKSRTTINNWLENETLIDIYRYFNPTTPSYTFRFKVNKENKIKKLRNVIQATQF